jgi:DNA helicase IV
VTTVDQVKGLELDYVVVADATALAYPDDPGSRRALYVAATRARHQLVLAAPGHCSPLLQIA